MKKSAKRGGAKSGHQESVKREKAWGLPGAKGGWPESQTGKPTPARGHDTNPQMSGVHIHVHMHSQKGRSK